jgi:hypothetical protein
MPLAIRRALPYELVLTSAWTSTSSGLDAAQNGGPGGIGGAFSEEQLRWIGHGPEPGARHLEHPQLAHRAEAVLDGTHDAVRVVLFAFEIQHGVDDVLERLRSGQTPVLGDVADQEGRNVLALGREEQLGCRLANLADAAGGRLELEREHGLDRIDNDERGPQPGDLFENALEAGLREDVERRAFDAEPFTARFDLVLGLFPRAVEDRPDCFCEVRRRLQQQCRLADAGLAADQHERSRDDAPAQDTIELADA